MRSWRLLGLRSKREALGGLSWNILENSGLNGLVSEYLEMLLDVALGEAAVSEEA